jgi:hypothetical protein
MIVFACDGCGKRIEVDEDLAGRKLRCKPCGAVTRVPTVEPPAIPLARLPAATPTDAPRRTPAVRKKKKRKPGTIDRETGMALAIGAGLALVALAVPLVGFVLHVLVTVVHELGHTAVAWLLGSPALPSFDLSYGGGVSHIFTRQPVLILGVYGVLAFLSFRSLGDRPKLIAWLVGVGLYTIAVFSPLRGLLITAAGHGSELVFAGIFLYRALSGNQILRNEERPLYAFLGLYIVLADARFAYQLMASREHREDYGDAKGGGHWMDFDQIANDYLHWRLEGVATLFLLACIATPVAAFLYHRYGKLLK